MFVKFVLYRCYARDAAASALVRISVNQSNNAFCNSSDDIGIFAFEETWDGCGITDDVGGFCFATRLSGVVFIVQCVWGVVGIR